MRVVRDVHSTTGQKLIRGIAVIKFEILGTFQARTSTSVVKFRESFQRVLLQTLLVSEGRVIPVEFLVRELWGDDTPEGVANALQAHISRTRKWLQQLEPERHETRLSSHRYGYAMDMEGLSLDAVSFVRAVRQALALRESSTDERVRTLNAALVMWRGSVFGGCSGGPLCRTAAARYGEYRQLALEHLFAAQLDAGRQALALGDLLDAHAETPLREKFCEQLMVALYRSGRQVEALEVYRRMRQRLAEECGLDPSPSLKMVEQAILNHDSWLQTPSEPGRRAGAVDASCA